MKSLFRYPGAKTKLLPQILERMPLSGASTYVDAFVGGGSVALEVAERYPALRLWLNDLDPTLAAFWTLVATGTLEQDEEMVALLRVPVTIERFYQLRESEPQSLVDRAYRAVFFNRTTFSGIAKASPIGGRCQKSKWSVSCRYNAEKLCKAYASTVQLLRGRTEVTCLDARTVMCSLPVPSFTYLDPPYYDQGPALYSVSMTPADHAELARVLQERGGWLLSYDNAPEIRALYTWARIEEVGVRYSVRGEKKKWVGNTELLISP